MKLPVLSIKVLLFIWVIAGALVISILIVSNRYSNNRLSANIESLIGVAIPNLSSNYNAATVIHQFVERQHNITNAKSLEELKKFKDRSQLEGRFLQSIKNMDAAIQSYGDNNLQQTSHEIKFHYQRFMESDSQLYAAMQKTIELNKLSINKSNAVDSLVAMMKRHAENVAGKSSLANKRLIRKIKRLVKKNQVDKDFLDTVSKAILGGYSRAQFATSTIQINVSNLAILARRIRLETNKDMLVSIQNNHISQATREIDMVIKKLRENPVNIEGLDNTLLAIQVSLKDLNDVMVISDQSILKIRRATLNNLDLIKEIKKQANFDKENIVDSLIIITNAAKLFEAKTKIASQDVIVQASNTTIIVGASLMTLMVVLGWTIRNRLSNSLKLLSLAMQDIASGTLESEINYKRRDEFGRLFNEVRITKFKLKLILKEQKEARKKADKLKEQAVAANKSKSTFLANMSHEIRTPMNGIMGMTSIVLETELNDEQQDCLQTINSSASSLLDLMNDIIDLSKIEAGKMQVSPVEFDIRVAIDELTDLLAPQAQAKGVLFDTHIMPNVPDYLLGDPGRIRQVLLNLVGNAIKFTPEGYVHINIKCASLTETSADLIFDVEDTGVGIARDKLDLIFEGFTQEDESTTRKFGGTGLGLTISKLLIDLLGGEIRVASQQGKGSVFSVLVTLPIVKKTLAIEQDKVILKDLKLAILDRGPASWEGVQELVEHWGIKTHCFDSGASALAALSTSQSSSSPYSLVISNSVLTDMIADEFAKKLRVDSGFRELPLLMLTSTPEPGDMKRYQAVGFDAYLPRPFLSHMLKSILVICLKKEKNKRQIVTKYSVLEQKAAADKNTKYLFPFKVLLVEDNIINQKVANKMLQSLGCESDLAKNGELAVQAWQEKSYDCIFMDCQMPVMDGYQATKEIRQQEQSASRIPIIALTANAMAGDKKKCIAAGMDLFLSKPITKNKLADILKKVVQIIRPDSSKGTPVASEELHPLQQNPLSALNQHRQINAQRDIR